MDMKDRIAESIQHHQELVAGLGPDDLGTISAIAGGMIKSLADGGTVEHILCDLIEAHFA